jgi:hypothetical protein
MEQMEMFEKPANDDTIFQVLCAVMAAQYGNKIIFHDASIDRVMERVGTLELTRTPDNDGFVLTVTPPKVEVTQ